MTNSQILSMILVDIFLIEMWLVFCYFSFSSINGRPLFQTPSWKRDIRLGLVKDGWEYKRMLNGYIQLIEPQLKFDNKDVVDFKGAV